MRLPTGIGVVTTGSPLNGDYEDKAIGERPQCKYCDSEKVIKWGKRNGIQRFKCKECEHVFDGNGNFPDMQTDPKVIAVAIDLYFEGLSLRKVSRQLKKIFGIHVSFRNILYWIEKYGGLVGDFVRNIEPPRLCRNWQVGESKLRMEGDWKWLWEAIDEDTRFLVATHVSEKREIDDAVDFFEDYPWSEYQKPRVITTDGLQAYHKGINTVFYSRYAGKRTVHRRSPGLTAKQGNTNKVERVHGTLKDRTKSLRGFKKMDTAILKAWPIHYNYLRPHGSLNGRTPAQASGVCLPFEDGWGDMIHWATVFQNKKDEDIGDCTEIELVAET